MRIWGTDNPHVLVEHVLDTPKVSVFCAVSSTKVYGPFFFAEHTVTSPVYLDMLQQWLIPQLQEDSRDFIYQEDGAPPHFHHDGHGYLNDTLPHRWIGRASQGDSPLLPWPPRSPDLTPRDFFLWGYVKDHVFLSPMPLDLAELRQRIEHAVPGIDHQMFVHIWQELDYRIDVCRVTNGGHMEHL